MDNKRENFQEKFEREKLRRHVEILRRTRDEWHRRKETLTEAVRPLKRQYKAALKKNNEEVAENMKSYRKLIGVTENVYAGKNEFEHELVRRDQLTRELADLQRGIMEFKYLVRSAMHEKRVLTAEEFWGAAREAKLYGTSTR